MGLSYVTYTGANNTATYSFANIDLLDDDLVTYASQLRVYVDNNLQEVNVAYTVSVINETITFQAGYLPADGAIIKIARFTKSDDRYINYTNSTNITANILNTDAKQLFYLTQEAIDLRDNAIVLNNEDKWEGRTKVLSNIAAGEEADDAVNVAQLTAALTGTIPTTLGTKGYNAFTGDGSTTTFDITLSTSGFQAKDIEVFVNGVKQTPTDAYTFAAPTITFDPAPPSAAKIEVLWNLGTVPGTFAANSVTNGMIQANAVTDDKISAVGDTTNHVLYVTNSPSGAVAWGQIPSTTISNFDASVRSSRLDQMATPTADVNMGSRKLTNLGAPTAINDAATKLYVDGRSKEVWYEIPSITAIGIGTWGQGQTNISLWQRRQVVFSGLSTVNKIVVQIPIHTGKAGDTVANAGIIHYDTIEILPSARSAGYGNTGHIYGYESATNNYSTANYSILYYYWSLNGNTFDLAVYNIRAGNFNYLYYNNPAIYPLPAGATTSSTPRYTNYGDWYVTGWTFYFSGPSNT